MHGVKRVAVFCVMIVIFPALLITTPLYLRHSVFADVVYPVAESDVLAIEHGISSIFCQGHSLKMNTSFNAFQLKGTPSISKKRKHIRLKKSMTLPDDTLEYWGFFLLKGALVKLKVCSRFEGSKILVVRGEKNLHTCGLLDHNLNKKDAKFDREHNQVKVTYENIAEIGLVDHNGTDRNTAAEDLTVENSDLYVKDRIKKGKERQLLKQNVLSNENVTKTPIKHHKRHIKRKKHHQRRVKDLKEMLDKDEDIVSRQKRATNTLDVHIRHGGNAHNGTNLNNEESSVSSFEMDLYICYDNHILLTKEFAPSQLCEDVHYLEKGNHMMTTHEVSSDGYYYYIFYSDNDLTSNSIHAIFDIYKPTYHYANSSSNECINKTECNFDLKFMSDETVIVEVPTRDGIEHEADDITLLVSMCQPRMAIYMVFPISVLFLILGCAFL